MHHSSLPHFQHNRSSFSSFFDLVCSLVSPPRECIIPHFHISSTTEVHFLLSLIWFVLLFLLQENASFLTSTFPAQQKFILFFFCIGLFCCFCFFPVFLFSFIWNTITICPSLFSLPVFV
uniref:Uncharacterized protein n=1 Tax=Cacopsylla melanoneura TaxID=428564 RepID=A0A8D8Z854_9HEMI